MRSFLTAAFIFGIALALLSQNSIRPEISLFSTQALESRSVSKGFFSDFYGGHYLDSAVKQDAIGQLNQSNFLGVLSYTRADVSLNSDKKLSLRFSGTHQTMLSAGFTSSFFELIFTGNSHLCGETVLMDPGSFHKFSFSTIHGGLNYKLNDQFSVYFSLGPAFLYSFAKTDFSKSTFFTSATADSLALQLNGDYQRDGGSAMISGTGFTFEIGAFGETGKASWKIMASNIGNFWVNKHSISSSRDTLISFTGFEISNLSDFSASAEQELDQLEQSLNLKGDTERLSLSPPMLLYGEYRQRFGKLNTGSSFMYINMPGFVPLLGLHASYPIAGALRICVPLKYGGWGSFNAGLGLEYSFSGRWSAMVNLPMLLGLGNPLKPVSYMGMARLTYKISANESSF